VEDKKTRQLSIRVSERIDDKLNDFSNRYGMSKSSLIAFILGQWVDAKINEENRISKAIDTITDADSLKDQFGSLAQNKDLMISLFEMFDRKTSDNDDLNSK